VRTLLLALLAPLLLATVAACADGGPPDRPTLVIVTPTSEAPLEEPTNTPEPGATLVTPEPATADPIPTSTPGEDGVIILACGDLLAPLDKLHRLDAACAPTDLVVLPAELLWAEGRAMRREAALALESLLNAAAVEGHNILVRSAYRSYDLQQAVFDANVALNGLEQTKRDTAIPGHSEHQLGTTADVTSASVDWELYESFGVTPEGLWIAAHSWEYGFIISYPDGFEEITGYSYEPWHVRYVGVSVAADVVASGLTLHEYLLQ